MHLALHSALGICRCHCGSKTWTLLAHHKATQRSRTGTWHERRRSQLQKPFPCFRWLQGARAGRGARSYHDHLTARSNKLYRIWRLLLGTFKICFDVEEDPLKYRFTVLPSSYLEDKWSKTIYTLFFSNWLPLSLFIFYVSSLPVYWFLFHLSRSC